MDQTIDDILSFDSFQALSTSQMEPNFRRQIRLFCVFGCAAAEVIFATNDDRVYGFGRNRFGGLGLGSESEVKQPQLNPTLSGKKISNFVVGFEHWIALTADGLCYSWGNNQKGQLGIGSLEASRVPQLIDGLADEMITKVCCGGFHSLALTSDGQVYSWGDNQFGQLGEHSFNNQSVPTQICIPEDVVSISCGKKHSMALTETGKVYLWGINGYGQLGVYPHRNCEQKCRPEAIPSLRSIEFTKAICGPNHSLLLSSDGSLYAFGENTVGQVGNGSVEHQYKPVQIEPDIQFKDVFTNKENELSIGISTDNRVYIWGSVSNRRCSTPKELSDCSGLSLFDIYAKYAKNKITYKTVVVGSDLKPWELINGCAKEVDDNGNQTKYLSESPDKHKPTFEPNLNQNTHKLQTPSKKMEDFLDLDNFLKNKSIIDPDMRRRIRLLYVFGIYGSKVILATHDDKVYSFGHNRDGCLGLGTNEEHILKLTLNKTLSRKQLSDISSGYEHCIGLTASGRCYGWGRNNYGQLGIGHVVDTPVPTLLEDLTDKKVIQVSCGSYHSMALTSDGEVFSWGHNTFAQLGDRTYNSRERPTQVLINEPIASMSSGINHSLALTCDGYVYTWGVNESGQLGRERERDIRKGREKAMSNRPKLIPGFEDKLFKKAICGPNHTMLLTIDGDVYTFGDNTSGQIGNGLTGDQSLPHRVIIGNDRKLKNIITCFRDDISMAVTVDNKIYVWGFIQGQKLLKPVEIRQSLGKSLFDVYVKIAKNKVTFKAFNINEEIDRDVIDIEVEPYRRVDHKNIAESTYESSEEYSQCNGTENNQSADDEYVFTENEDQMIETPITATIGSTLSVQTTNDVSNSETNSEEVFLKHLRQSFNNQKNYDLIIRSDDSVIYCHKTILQIRNPKFYEILSQRIQSDGSSSEVSVNGESYKSFYAFIQFLYAIEPEMDIQVIPDLKKMSQYFEEPELKDICAHKLKLLENVGTGIDLSSVCQLYQKAIADGLTDLEKSCVAFAKNNWKAIVKTDYFESLEDSTSKRFISSVL